MRGVFPKGNKGLFKKGLTPWNKGTKGVCQPNQSSFHQGQGPNATSFKAVAIGTVSTRRNGRQYVKTAEGWRYIAKKPRGATARPFSKPARRVRVCATVEEYNAKNPYGAMFTENS